MEEKPERQNGVPEPAHVAALLRMCVQLIELQMCVLHVCLPHLHLLHEGVPIFERQSVTCPSTRAFSVPSAPTRLYTTHFVHY